MTKNEKQLANDLVNEVKSLDYKSSIPQVVVTTAKALKTVLKVAKIFTSDKTDIILDKLIVAIDLFLTESGS